MRAGSREPDVGGLNAERLDQVQDAQLLVDSRASDRGGLQPVPQSLVREQDGTSLRDGPVIPVEDEAFA